MIALFDLDGTLADYDKALREDLEKIRSPGEPPLPNDLFHAEPYVEARRHMITSQVGWWRKLERFQLGWDILKELRGQGYDISVLTKGPSRKSNAWSEKIEWCADHLPDTGVTITHNKGLIYGKVLVDDFPEYVLAWLYHRPRGRVIMPAQPCNINFKHPQVVRYDGTNIEEVRAHLGPIDPVL